MSTSWRERSAKLPIIKHLDTIVRGVLGNQLSLLEAPPGSGKTTVLPLALLEDPAFAHGRIVMLQPRRLAAKSVATRMAEMLGEQVGERVGYRVRMDSNVSGRTRIEVITEGLLTRKLVADPSLAGVSLLILDEFHERSLHGDIGLALALETCAVLRPDLKILIMSATLGESLPPHLTSAAWRFTFEGTPFPVRVSYQPSLARDSISERVSAAVRAELSRSGGDILAFLPGAYEISRVADLLTSARGEHVVIPLYGDLPYAEQQRALIPDPQSRRKVVLATTIAETSLTIDGVTTVIDSGLHKVARSDKNGSTTLITEPISRDAADQRAGRAGRTAPGTCVRLWSEQEHIARRATREPEVLRADCTSACLDLAAWGVSDPLSFGWITPPPQPALKRAISTLGNVGAISADGRITDTGRALASLGTNPRLGRMALEARRIGASALAGSIIATLEERDFTSRTAQTTNIEQRLRALESRAANPGARRAADLAEKWRVRIEKLPIHKGPLAIPVGEQLGYLLASAFPESIAKRREEGSPRYLLASGVGATLPAGDPLLREELLVIASMRGGSTDNIISLAAPLSSDTLRSRLTRHISQGVELTFDDQKGQLVSEDVVRCGAIILQRRPNTSSSPGDRTKALIQWLSTAEGFSRLPWPQECQALKERIAWARSQAPSLNLPDVSDDALRGDIDQWLAPFIEPGASLKTITPALVSKAIDALLPWNIRRELDLIAPTTVKLPNGRSRAVDYSSTESPVIAAKVQELFGWNATPPLGSLKVSPVIHLLSPAGRPVQVTRDLASFWRVSYPEVRKELRGRYPKHKWPEDPFSPR